MTSNKNLTFTVRAKNGQRVEWAAKWTHHKDGSRSVKAAPADKGHKPRRFERLAAFNALAAASL